MGSKVAPPEAATKVTEQATHQAAIGAALVYASELPLKGTRAVALTIESVTALRNLRAAHTDEGEPSQSAQGEGTPPPPPLRQGAAQETQDNRHKKRRLNPRPDRKRGRDDAGAGNVGNTLPGDKAPNKENTGAREVGGTRPSDPT